MSFSKFTSRKFLAAVGGFITAAAAHNYGAAAAVLVTYIAAEAHVDAKSAAADTTHTNTSIYPTDAPEAAQPARPSFGLNGETLAGDDV